jgi:hypothetical protein
MFTAVGEGGYVAEKAEGSTGWLFPVGDEIGSLGYVEMFADMLNSLDAGYAPMEDFYDGYVVNAIMDAAYRSAQSKQWEAVLLDDWRGDAETDAGGVLRDYDDAHYLIKEEKMPDGRTKFILKLKDGGKIIQKVV